MKGLELCGVEFYLQSTGVQKEGEITTFVECGPVDVISETTVETILKNVSESEDKGSKQSSIAI